MMTSSINNLALSLGINPWVMWAIIAWVVIWKGLALWKAAELRQKYWFIAFLIINTLGILEIIYLYLIACKYKVEVIED